MMDRISKRLNGKQRLSGLSLLEVVLALAILGAAGAMLAQSMQVATDAGVTARDQALAELLVLSWAAYCDYTEALFEMESIGSDADNIESHYQS